MNRLVSVMYFLLLLVPEWLFSQGGADSIIISKSFYSVEDGLASREVFCAIQDNEGFMWFGTRNGLNRYDGKNFRLYNKQRKGLPENKVIQLAKDKKNHLFVLFGSQGFARFATGIAVMDLTTKKLHTLKKVFPNLPFDQESVYWVASSGDDVCFLTDRPARYWRLTSKGFELKCEMKLWQNSTDQETRVSGPTCVFYRDCALLKLSNQFPQYFCSNDTTRLLKGNYPTVSAYSNGILIGPDKQPVDIWDDVYQKLPDDGRQQTKRENIFNAYAKEGITFFSGDFSNALLYLPKDGVFYYDFHTFTRLLDRELMLSTSYILNSYYIDWQNNIWLCCSGGLIRIKREKNSFTHYFTKQALKDSSVNQARGIYADGNGKLFASIWTKLGYHSANRTLGFTVGEPNVILYGLTRCMNKIYVGNSDIYLVDQDKPYIHKRLTHSIRQEMWSLDSLAPDKLLVGYTDTMLTYNISKGELKPVAYRRNIPRARFVYRFLIRKDKTVWAVAENGLYLVNPQADSVIEFFGKSAKDPAHQFPFDFLHDAYEDDTGVVWLATSGEGLYRWNRKKHLFTQFSPSDGLPSDILYRIESDHNKHLWISTDNGLLWFNPVDFNTRTYSTVNGLSHNEFNRTSSFKAKDGRLYFGGLDGVSAFYPQDFTHDTSAYSIPLRLISLSKLSAANGMLVDLTEQIHEQRKIVLQPNDKFFSLEFQLLDFNDGKPNYAYIIEGVDADWNYITENSIRISGLPYGKHLLRIKGQSQSGQWSKNELNIPLVVLKPFYLQWWFITATFILAALAFTAWYRWRVRQLIRAKLSLEQRIKDRTKALEESLLQEQALRKEKDVLLKEIHHRVKNNLQVISGLLELQEKNLADEGARQALHEGRTRVRSMALIHQNLYQYENLSRIELSSFVHDLYEQVSSMYAIQGSSTKTNVQIPVTEIDIDTAVPFGLMLNELLTNSFKYSYSDKKELRIEMTLKVEQVNGKAGDEYIFVYADSGPGLPAGFEISRSKSLGMRLISDLTRQMGGSMQYAFEHGSRFFIKFYDKAARNQND